MGHHGKLSKEYIDVKQKEFLEDREMFSILGKCLHCRYLTSEAELVHKVLTNSEKEAV